MTTFRPLTDDDWQRMSWVAKQQWNLAATRLMRQVRADLEALERDERSRAALRRATGMDAESIRKRIPDDPRGPSRLAQATREAEGWTLRSAS